MRGSVKRVGGGGMLLEIRRIGEGKVLAEEGEDWYDEKAKKRKSEKLK